MLLADATPEVLTLPGVVPVLVGPLQVLLTILPGIIVGIVGGIITMFKPSGMKNLAKLLWQQKLAVSLLALVVTGGVFAVRAMWPGVAVDASTEARRGTDWPTARGDLRRTGALPGTPSPNRAKLNWSFAEWNEGFWASPAVVGNRVYVTSHNRSNFSKTGSVYCFDADTGAIVWTKAPDNFRWTFSSPVVVGEYLVCGEGVHDTIDARVVCMKAKDGEIVWTFSTNNHVECTPIVADGRVYVGAGDDGYYCLDLKPGPDGNAKVLWHLPRAKYPDAETSLAVHEGKVYAGLGNDGQALCVLDAVTGDELNRVATPYPVFGPPAIDKGKIFVGMGKGDYVKSGVGGEVRCLDLATLKTEWTFPLKQTVLGAIALRDDKIYFGSRDGFLYCLTRDGKLAGKYDSHSPIVTAPAVTDQAVYVVNEEGMLFALDRQTLEPWWEFRVGAKPKSETSPGFLSSPVVAHGRIYVGTFYNGFLCVGEVSKDSVVPLWTNPIGGPGKAGNRDNSPIPTEVDKLWTYQGDPSNLTRPPTQPTSIACYDKELYVHYAGKKSGIACLPRDTAPGAHPKARWTYEIPGDITAPPVVLQDMVLFVEQAGSSAVLHGLDRGTGKLRWKKDMPGGTVVAVTTQHILVHNRLDGPANHLGFLRCLDRDGNDVWDRNVWPGERVVQPPAFSPNLLLVASLSAGKAKLKALDRESGELLWETPLAEVPRTAPFIDKAHFLLATESGLEKRSLLDGKLVPTWQPEGGAPGGEIAVRILDIYYVNKAGELIVLERDTGKVKARLASGDTPLLPNIPPLVSRNQIIVATKAGLCLVALEKPDPLALWYDFAADKLGPPVAPMVLHDSRIYFPTRDHGLVCVGGTKNE